MGVAQPCVWKVPAFCPSSSSFLDPEYLRERSRSFRRLRMCRNAADSSTDDIWENAHLRNWAAADNSSLILIQGCSQSVERLEWFSVEVCDYLSERQPTICILNGSLSREYFAKTDESQLLRQLAIQALRKASPDKPISFLATIISKFQHASSSEDWFDILEVIFRERPNLFVIADVGALSKGAEAASVWPSSFEQLLSRLGSSSTARVSVMLLSSRPFSPSYNNAPVVSVVSGPVRARGFPERLHSRLKSLPERSLPLFIPKPPRSDSLAVEMLPVISKDDTVGSGRDMNNSYT